LAPDPVWTLLKRDKALTPSGIRIPDLQVRILTTLSIILAEMLQSKRTPGEEELALSAT